MECKITIRDTCHRLLIMITSRGAVRIEGLSLHFDECSSQRVQMNHCPDHWIFHRLYLKAERRRSNHEK